MRFRLSKSWERIRGSYWFFPGIMAVAAVVLAVMMIEADKALDSAASTTAMQFGLISEAGADGVRAVLQAIAGSMITVAGTVFSIVIIALTLASQQFGPRILRNFMRDRGNQMVLGTFTATFLYCILILRTVSGRESATFVPHASALVAVFLAILSVGVLIYFIHHAAIMIQAPFVIANVGKELEEQIDRLFPDTLGRPGPKAGKPGDARRGRGGGRDHPHERRVQALTTVVPPDFEQRSSTVCILNTGYLQSVDESDLLRVAKEHDLIINLRLRPGTFAVRGEPCLQVYPSHRLTDDLAKELAKTLTFGRARTAEQDVSFAIDQLVEVAARSLSPSLNDPFTAISCIDRLGEAFSLLATREIPSPYRHDDEGQLRVIAQPLRMVDLVLQSIEPIRQYGASHMLIALRLLDTLAIVGPFAHREEDRKILVEEIDRIRKSAEEQHNGDPQRQRIVERAEVARRAVLRRDANYKHATGNPMH
jgi:uncharacterized membrane protein